MSSVNGRVRSRAVLLIILLLSAGLVVSAVVWLGAENRRFNHVFQSLEQGSSEADLLRLLGTPTKTNPPTSSPINTWGSQPLPHDIARSVVRVHLWEQGFFVPKQWRVGVDAQGRVVAWSFND